MFIVMGIIVCTVFWVNDSIKTHPEFFKTDSTKNFNNRQHLGLVATYKTEIVVLMFYFHQISYYCNTVTHCLKGSVYGVIDRR